MKCDEVSIPNPEGGEPIRAIICTRGRRHNCQFCSRWATKQCDFPVVRKGKDVTCDAWMCDRCATKQSPSADIDFCPPHERNKVKIMEARLGFKEPELSPEEAYLNRHRSEE
jgi:pyruvate-formate lyase-activating enzyme